jgi:nucleoside-diphosphate-sugar epimerase
MAMKVLMIGGTRFAGAHAARQFHAAGAAVTVYHRGRTRQPDLPPVEHVTDERAGWPVLAFPPTLQRDWDVVVHMGAMGERDTQAAVDAFRGRARRFVLISSADVYRAYGRLTKMEPGEPDPTPLGEDAPLRTVFYPYRGMAASLGEWARDYEKIQAEAVFRASSGLEWVILRFPKLYGAEDNADLATIYGFASAPHWRWTHAHAANAAAAIVLAASHPLAAGGIFNVGERGTPTMGERLSSLAARPGPVPALPDFDFRQSLVLDTSRIRDVLRYRETLDERAAMAALAGR